MSSETDNQRNDKREKLNQLRSENAERWQQLRRMILQSRHQPQQEEPDDTNNDTKLTNQELALRYLELDYDLLVKQGEWTVASNRILSSLLPKSPTTTTTTSSAQETAQTEWLEELVETHYDLQKITKHFQDSLARERAHFESIRKTKNELIQYQNELAYDLRRLSNNSHTTLPKDHNDLEQTNKDLYKDLQYVTEAIDKQLSCKTTGPIRSSARRTRIIKTTVTPTTVEQQQESGKATNARMWTLHRLVKELVDRLLSGPTDTKDGGHAYLSIDPALIPTEYLKLLRTHELIESYMEEDDNTIRLIDYGK